MKSRWVFAPLAEIGGQRRGEGEIEMSRRKKDKKLSDVWRSLNAHTHSQEEKDIGRLIKKKSEWAGAKQNRKTNKSDKAVETIEKWLEYN